LVKDREPSPTETEAEEDEARIGVDTGNRLLAKVFCCEEESVEEEEEAVEGCCCCCCSTDFRGVEVCEVVDLGCFGIGMAKTDCEVEGWEEAEGLVGVEVGFTDEEEEVV
jgi:hypothetical protein